MTGPAVVQPPHILSGDEWDAAQYAPHRLANDPKQPLPAGRILTGDEWEKASASSSVNTLTFPAMPKFQSDATSRLNPNAGPEDRSVPTQLGAGVRSLASGFDAAALGLDPTSAAAAHVVGAIGRQVVAPAVEHPIQTAAMLNPVGGLIGAGMAVHTIAQYGWQAAHEMTMSPDERATAQANPNRVSGEAAAVQAVMLGLGALAGVHAVSSAAEGATDAAASAKLSPYFETPKGADVLGTAAARRGLPETASPYPPESPLTTAWQEGHATATQSTPATEAPPVASEAPASTAPAETPPVAAAPSEATAGEPEITPPAEPISGKVVKEPYAPTGKTVPSVPIRDENGALQRNLGRVATEDLHTEWQRLAEQNNAEEALHAGAQEAGYRFDYNELHGSEKSGIAGKSGRDMSGVGDGLADPERIAADNKIIADYRKSAVARAARVKAMDRIRAEIEKRPDATEFSAMANAYDTGTPGARPLAPVAGTGELRTRGLSAGVEQKAVAKELTDYLGDLPQYARLSMQDQAGKATDLLSSDYARARRIALGDESAPDGLLPESVFVAVENHAIAQGDVATLRDLASGGITERATTMGQSIRTLGERNPDSPVKAIEEITKVRGGGGAESAGAVRGMVDELKVHLDEAHAITPDAWQSFINSLRC